MEYSSQVETVINYIRKHPGCPRFDLIDLRSNGERIANLTARISNARKRLLPLGETIVCSELSSRKIGRTRLRRTTYEIKPLSII